ncbi:hypothetical protein G7Y89_g11341 [Cudoniella acicularis]|uniref:fumarylacetoacetase n=1 Tax=Cudoniella acicularis TaxID=354080 RepID=A0A8H4RC47_9HELO|nr:hypothetical protein G7Y89_g11341 [Cudoniella acicularis]
MAVKTERNFATKPDSAMLCSQLLTLPTDPTAVFFVGHGSTMMLGEESEPASFWKEMGDEAMGRGIKSIVMMGAHWEALGDEIQVAMNPKPQQTPVAYVAPKRYKNFVLTPDLVLGSKVLSMLQVAGFNAKPNPTFDFIHDTFLILIRMFPHMKTCIPVTAISANARFDPHYHAKVGSILRPLRYENVLIIGSGGTVHNLYCNHWTQMVIHGANFAQPVPPAPWALEFRQAVEDPFTGNSGPVVRRALNRFMKHPRYRDAHGTDGHFMAAIFAAEDKVGRVVISIYFVRRQRFQKYSLDIFEIDSGITTLSEPISPSGSKILKLPSNLISEYHIIYFTEGIPPEARINLPNYQAHGSPGYTRGFASSSMATMTQGQCLLLVDEQQDMDKSFLRSLHFLKLFLTSSLKKWDCLGNILIVGESPAPIASSIIPLIFTIAAGNTAIIILPFETPSVAKVLKAVIKSSVDVEAFAAFAPTSEHSKMELISELSGTKFHGLVCQDTAFLAHIESIGLQTQKKVLLVRSQLAGLMPVIITRHADIRRAAQQLTRCKVSKLTEGCRTCPSYVLVDDSSKSKQPSTTSLNAEKEWDDKGRSQLEFGEMKISVGSRQPIHQGQHLEMLKKLIKDPHNSSSSFPIIPTTSMESSIDLINDFLIFIEILRNSSPLRQTVNCQRPSHLKVKIKMSTVDFPVSNVPYGIISTPENPICRPATIIEDTVLDLSALESLGAFDTIPDYKSFSPTFQAQSLNSFAGLAHSLRLAVRQRIQEIWTTPDLRLQYAPAFHPSAAVINHLPMDTRSYTDYLSSLGHFENIQDILSSPMPRRCPFYHSPLGYYSNSRSIVISGTPIYRFTGMTDGQFQADNVAVVGQAEQFDFELELGIYIGKTSKRGQPIEISKADDYVFGFVLLNDWSARDIQRAESGGPTGPYLAKSAGVTVSPWIITLDALQEARTTRLSNVKAKVPWAEYLQEEGVEKGTFDIRCQANWKRGENDFKVCDTQFAEMYWGYRQLISHQTRNGSQIGVGDLIGTGTMSKFEASESYESHSTYAERVITRATRWAVLVSLSATTTGQRKSMPVKMTREPGYLMAIRFQY